VQYNNLVYRSRVGMNCLRSRGLVRGVQQSFQLLLGHFWAWFGLIFLLEVFECWGRLKVFVAFQIAWSSLLSEMIYRSKVTQYTVQSRICKGILYILVVLLGGVGVEYHAASWIKVVRYWVAWSSS
jgi:hypothetical protein